MDLTHSFLWRKLRERKILASHRRVVAICNDLIKQYTNEPTQFEFVSKKHFDSKKIIWQYWAQGFDNIPDVVQKCLESVDRYASDYTIIRLSDSNLNEYLDIPDFIHAKRGRMTIAHFSDLLRLMLLKTYGGIWMDATILMSGPIPESWADNDFFVFRRDPKDPDYRYWRNTYAYYFGWAPGFRVNMLNSFIVAKKGGKTVSDLCDLMLLWWKEHDDIPDYFFFQILCDVRGYQDDFPLISDTLPHRLQQSLNDSSFCLASLDDILSSTPIHKMTYK